MQLKGSGASMTATSDTAWTLEKEGLVDASSSSVTWTVTVTEGATTPGRLVVDGTLTVENKGGQGATIGNIVVNLMTKTGNQWTTRSSNIADATLDGAATTAKVVASATLENVATFTENAATGDLLFMDADTNSVFSLVPQVTIPPGVTRTLLFQAEFDNNVLGLAQGTATRTEVLVSFGNAAEAGPGATNLDINGNGIVDGDEARVKTVASRLNLSVPATTPGNNMPTLTDTTDDLTTTGTVTYSNPVFNLGPTGGTVSLTYDGGANGGTITNCAHLTSADSTAVSGGFAFTNVAGLDLVACDTQTIGPHACVPGTVGCGWEEGDMLTYVQDQWGDDAHPAGALLQAHYDSVYASTFGALAVGILGVSGFSIVFTGYLAVLDYLPSAGVAGPLTSDQLNPISSASGDFGAGSSRSSSMWISRRPAGSRARPGSRLAASVFAASPGYPT